MGLTWRSGNIVLPLFLALALFTACSSSEPSKTAGNARPSPRSKFITPGAGCSTPKEKADPKWMPGELPLPKGTFFYRDLGRKGGFDRGRFVISLDTIGFRKFVRDRWPQADISLARQDTEPGEVESLFTTPQGTGLFKANDVLCEPPYTTLLLIYSK